MRISKPQRHPQQGVNNYFALLFRPTFAELEHHMTYAWILFIIAIGLYGLSLMNFALALYLTLFLSLPLSLSTSQSIVWVNVPPYCSTFAPDIVSVYVLGPSSFCCCFLLLSLLYILVHCTFISFLRRIGLFKTALRWQWRDLLWLIGLISFRVRGCIPWQRSSLCHFGGCVGWGQSVEWVRHYRNIMWNKKNWFKSLNSSTVVLCTIQEKKRK